MNPSEEEVFEAAQMRRERNEICREVLAYLTEKERTRLQRGGAFLIIAVAIVAAAGFLAFRLGEISIQTQIIMNVAPAFLIWLALGCFYPDPRDKLLLLLAKEAVLKGDD